MGVNSRAEIRIGKSSVFEIIKIVEKLGYDFDFKTADIIKGVDEWLISQWEE